MYLAPLHDQQEAVNYSEGREIRARMQHEKEEVCERKGLGLRDGPAVIEV